MIIFHKSHLRPVTEIKLLCVILDRLMTVLFLLALWMIDESLWSQRQKQGAINDKQSVARKPVKRFILHTNTVRLLYAIKILKWRQLTKKSSNTGNSSDVNIFKEL